MGLSVNTLDTEDPVLSLAIFMAKVCIHDHVVVCPGHQSDVLISDTYMQLLDAQVRHIPSV